MSVGFNGIPDATSPGDLYAGILTSPGFRVAYPYSVSVWFKGPYVETRRNDCLVNLAGRSTANSIRLDCHVGQLRHRVNGQVALTTTYVKNNAWNHAMAIGASATDRRIYANGAGMGQSVVNVTPTVGDSATLGAHMSPGINPGWVSDSMFLGQLAEFAVWSSELTEAEIFELSHGANPLDFQFASLVYYHHLFNDFDVVYGAEINQSGVSYYQPIGVYACPQDHPPIAYAPASVRSVFMPDRGVPPMPPPIDSAPGSMSGRRRPSAPSGLIHRQPPSGLCRGGGGIVDLTTRAEIGGVIPMPVGALTAEQDPPETPEWYLMPYFSGFAMTSADMNSDGSIIYIMRANAKIYKSVDFGESWTEKNLGDDAWNGRTIKCDSTGNHVVFLHAASLGNPTRFWESVNAGVDWSYEDLSIEATDICMARDGSVIYVIHPSGLKKKTGGVWSTVTLPAGMSGLTPWRICCSADGAKVLIAGSKAYNSHEIWELISGTWTQVFTTTDAYYYFRDIKMAQDGSIALVTSAKTIGGDAVKNRARRGAHPTAWTDESIPMYGTYTPTYGVPSRLAITADGSVAFAVSRYNIAKLSSGTWEDGRGDDLPEDPYEWPYYWTGVTCSDDGGIVVAYTYGHISDPWDCAWIYK